MKKLLELENGYVFVSLVAICAVALVLILQAASNVGQERARQSVACVKAGGEWAETECRKGSGR